jgi:hypothetical protein
LVVNRLNSAVASFYVMPYCGHWSTPLMLAALAGVVHDRQCADGQQHNCGKDNEQWPLHGGEGDDDSGETEPKHLTNIVWPVSD